MQNTSSKMADFSLLRFRIKGRVFLPENNEFSLELKTAWSMALHDKKPVAIVKVTSGEDVAKAVEFCVVNKLDICVSCGATSEFAIVDDAVVIDLSLLDEVIVDTENKTAVIGGGAKNRNVDDALCPHGYFVPLGTYSLVGVAGMALFTGGIGYLTPSYGCTIDSIQEFKLVTANGQLIKASKDENQELFWGLKGHGANFGIVTSMKMEIHEMPQCLVGGYLRSSMTDAKDKIKAVRDVFTKIDAHRTCLHVFLTLTDAGWVLEVRILFNGPSEEGEKAVQALQNCTDAYENTCGRVNYHDFQRESSQLYSPEKYHYAAAGHFFRVLKDKIISNAVDAMKNLPRGSYGDFAGTRIYIMSMGGRMNEVEEASSSQAIRWARFRTAMNGHCAAVRHDEKGNEQFLCRVSELKKWADDYQKVNEEFGEPFYGGKADQVVPRLQALKGKYDLNNVFHHNINIAPPTFSNNIQQKISP